MTEDDNQNTSGPHQSSPIDDELLNELESIKGLLDKSIEEDENDIPVLEDVVENQQPEAGAGTELLDIEAIFDGTEGTSEYGDIDFNIEIPEFKLDQPEGSTPTTTPDNQEFDDLALPKSFYTETSVAPPEELVIADAPTEKISSSSSPDEGIDIHLLIQEIVDEQIPVLEDQLRKRLMGYSPAAIKALAKKLSES